MRNAEIGRMEDIDTSRNEAVLNSATDMHLSNAFTQLGQVGRDIGAKRANEGYNEAFFNNLKEYRGLYDLGSGAENQGMIDEGFNQFAGTINPIETAPAMEGAIDLPGGDDIDKYRFGSYRFGGRFPTRRR